MNRLIVMGIVVSVVVVVATVWMIRTRRLQERHALLWLAGALAIVVLGAVPPILALLSRALGIAYPPSTLFLVLVAFLALAVLDCVVVISRLTDRVRVLAQRLAMLEERLESSGRVVGTGPHDHGERRTPDPDAAPRRADGGGA